jgi:ribosome-binding factor A
MGRMEKVNQHIKREVGQIIIREIGDPRVKFVSVTRVDTSPDMQHAKVYFSVLGEAKQIEDAKAGLNSASGLIRHLLGKTMKTRHTPELRFIYDDSLVYSIEFEQKIKEIVNGSQDGDQPHQET